MEQAIARLAKLEIQLNERSPPLGQKVPEATTNLAAIAMGVGRSHSSVQDSGRNRRSTGVKCAAGTWQLAQNDGNAGQYQNHP